MNESALQYPEFHLPDPALNFLASEKSLYDYSNLYGFCAKFREIAGKYEISQRHPLALLSQSSDEYTFIISACYLLKIPFVPISPHLTEPELEARIKQISPAAFFTDRENEQRVQNYPIIRVKKEDLILNSTGETLDSPSSEPEKRFGYFFTSGSTGRPKIVPLKRRQILFATKGSELNFKPEENRYWLLCLPLNHIGGISIILRSILYGSAIFRMDHFDEHQVRNFLSENRLFQIASLVPTMLLRLLNDPQFQLHTGFKALLLGGGPVTTGLIERALERGIPIVSSYGMTETCAQIAANPMLQPRGIYYPKKSAGPVFKPNKVQIRDPETGSPMPYNEIGEIWLKGPQVIDEYMTPELNARAFDEDGWFKTGDMGHLGRQDQLFIKSRRSDLIITGGENVDPVEIEKVLNDLPEVIRSAVLGVEDAEWGQKIVAFIEAKPGVSIDTKKITLHLKKELSGFKIPKEIYIVNKIPVTPMGKLLRHRLPDLYPG